MIRLIALFPHFAELVLGRWDLLASQARYAHLSRRFQRGGDENQGRDLLLLIIGVIAIGGLAWLISQYQAWQERQRLTSSRWLFRELCLAHQLSWTNRQLLRRLARAYQMPDPTHLFLEPHRFERNHLPETLLSRREQLDRLRYQLFADAEPEEHTDTP